MKTYENMKNIKTSIFTCESVEGIRKLIEE
jgi:hypothetical protein